MFELKYSITDSDMRAVNKKSIMVYFALYLVVAVIGVAVGIVAAVLSDQTLMLVMGIILIVLGGILAACAVLLLVSPKNLIASAVKTGDAEYAVTVDDDGINVVGDESQAAFACANIIKVKNCKTYLLAYVGKDKVLLIKDAFTSSESSLAKLYETLEARHGCPVNPLREIKEQTAQAEEKTAETNEPAPEQQPEAEEEPVVMADEPVEQPKAEEPAAVEVKPAEEDKELENTATVEPADEKEAESPIAEEPAPEKEQAAAKPASKSKTASAAKKPSSATKKPAGSSGKSASGAAKSSSGTKKPAGTTKSSGTAKKPAGSAKSAKAENDLTKGD